MTQCVRLIAKLCVNLRGKISGRAPRYVNITTMRKTFPDAFQCYRPRSHKIYGTICISPSNRILLVRGRRSGKWSFPKGHLDGSETSHECAIRELYEETGISVTSSPVTSFKLSVGYYSLFEMEEVDPNIQDNDEIELAEWIPLNQIENLECNVDINCFLSRIRKSASRCQ